MTSPYGGETAGVMNNTDCRTCDGGDAATLDCKTSSRPYCNDASSKGSDNTASAQMVASGCESVNRNSGNSGLFSNKFGGDETGRTGV
jgi:hypothetical protein